jgi:hypothetical protein
MAWLLGAVGVIVGVAGFREWRIRRLEARHDPERAR